MTLKWGPYIAEKSEANSPEDIKIQQSEGGQQAAKR